MNPILTGKDFDRINDILSGADDLTRLFLSYHAYDTTGLKHDFEITCKEYGVTPQEFIFWYNF